MKKEIREKIGSVQLQWYFLVLAVFIALFAGLVGNAFYDLLMAWWKWSPLHVLIVFGSMLLVMIDCMTYWINGLEETHDTDTSLFADIQSYLKYRSRTVFKISRLR